MIQKDELRHKLEQFDLNKTQIDVYLTLVATGSSPASTLAKRVCIPRSTAKYTCQQLVNKGLVRESTQNQGSIYTAKKPSSLSKLVEEEKKQLLEKEKGLCEIVAQLESLQNNHFVAPKVVYYKGVSGLIEMFEDVLAYKEDFCCALKVEKNKPAEFEKFIQERYIPTRIKNGNHVRAIFADTPETREYQKRDKEMNRQTLLVDSTKFPIDVCYHIYGQKVAFYSLNKADLSGVIIENPFIHKTQKSIFEMAWNYAKDLQA